MTPEERARLIGIAARKLGWTNFLGGNTWYGSNTDDTIMSRFGELTDSGIVALLEHLLRKGATIEFARVVSKYVVWPAERASEANTFPRDTLADVLLSAIGEEG